MSGAGNAAGSGGIKRIAANRRATHDYFVLERIEAGVALCGTEVKSVRDGQVSFAGSFAEMVDGELWLRDMHIAPYERGNLFNHEPTRPRRLLLHRRQIEKLAVQTAQKGCTLVPLGVYLRNGRVKVEIGLCKGKQSHDKRDSLKEATMAREARQAMRRADRGGRRGRV